MNPSALTPTVHSPRVARDIAASQVLFGERQITEVHVWVIRSTSNSFRIWYRSLAYEEQGQPRERGMKEEGWEQFQTTNPVHEEVTQRPISFSLQGQGTLAVAGGAADSLALKNLLCALKTASISRNMASSSTGGKFEREQGDSTFYVGMGGVIMSIHYIYNHSTYCYDRAY